MNYIISEYKVLKSAAGYYIGRLCHEGDGLWIPYDRATGYYRSEFEANEILDNCFQEVKCL